MSDLYEIRASNYPHPERQRGQHVNGPASLFIRRVGGPWYRVRDARLARSAKLMIVTYGIDLFFAEHCELVQPPEPTP